MRLSATIDGYLRAFLADEEGVAMTEALLAVPLLTLIAAGVLEFGGVFWQREQIETGLRDAARYMARCRHDGSAYTTTTVNGGTCAGVARNLARYGNSAGTGPLRVLNWNEAITFAIVGESITATTTHAMSRSPMFGVLGIDQITVTANHNQRRIGW